jgi:uncharacterized protein (TIGR03067 family)
MKTLRSLLWGLGLAAAGLAGADASAQSKKVDTPSPATQELARLQGTWQAISYQFAGRRQPEEQIQHLTCVVAGNQAEHRNQEKVEGRFTLAVDPTRTPHHIDQTTPDGQTYRGIYRLSNDTLTICLPTDPTGARPRQFATEAGDGHVVRTYRKVEGQAPPSSDEPAEPKAKTP